MSIFKKNWKEDKVEDEWKQIIPPPNDIPSSWKDREYLIYGDGIKTGEITKWHNPDGKLTHYTWRRYNKDGKKLITPHTFHTQGNGSGIWKQKGWSGTKYFHDVHKIPGEEKPLLVVEGEKVMHFCNNDPDISKEFKATTWYGGVKNITHFNLECFKDKTVYLCPDNDEPGKEAMYLLGMKLLEIAECVMYMDIPYQTQKMLPHDKKAKVHYDEGWDLADELYKEVSFEDVWTRSRPFVEDHLDKSYWKKIEKKLKEEAEDKKVQKFNSKYAYVMANDMFNKLGTNEFFNINQINNFHAHEFEKGLGGLLLSKATTPKAITFATLPNHSPGIITIKKDGEVYGTTKGDTVLNIHIPNKVEPKEDDIEWLLDHFRDPRIFGPDKWRIVEQFIGYQVQYPGRKCKWAIVVASKTEGVGKGLLARMFSSTLGSYNVNENANYKHLINNHNTLLIGKQVVVINELSLGDFKSKMEGTNSLKNFIADDHYTCNFKGKPMVILPNKTAFLLFSQDPRVVKVDNGGRRYYFINVKISEGDLIKISDSGFFEKAWNYVDSDRGKEALLHYFKNVKIDDPNIFQRRAPITDDLLQLREQSKHPVQKKLEFHLSNKWQYQSFFDWTWYSGLIYFDDLNDRMTKQTDYSTKWNWGSYGDDALYKFIEDNCIPWNNGENTRQIEINGTRRRLYILSDVSLYKDKSYKDLTPKQIEKHFLHYNEISRAIREEKAIYEKAVEIFNKVKTYKQFKGQTDPEIRRFLINQGDPKHDKLWMDKFRIINRGVRPTDHIVDQFDLDEFKAEQDATDYNKLNL